MNRSIITHTLAKGIRLLAVAALLAGWAVALQPATPAYAATLTVTTSNDVVGADGQCSLREAINNANADADTTGGECVNTGGPYGADTITFAAATNGVPIVLGGAAGEDANASGDLDILGAGDNLTIQGNGAANTIIDGNNADRVFHVCPTGVCANTVTFNGLTIRNGSAPAAGIMGGGIYNQGSTLNVQNSTVSANRAFLGGGIYNDFNCNATVTGSTVISNTANNDGGGIYNMGATTVTGSRILNNAAAVGGGIHNQINIAGATNVTGSCIVGNSANSFQNNMAAQQTATGNWWGAAAGPNTLCADTTGGNVDTTGFLIAPILGCPANCPDLQVNKANDTGGNGTVGTPFNWTLTISNTDAADATFNVPQVILADDLPAGPTYGAPAPGNFSNITNTANISCTIALNTLTCDAQPGSVTIGAATGSFDVVFSVTPGTAGALNNPAGNCRVDPNGNVAESNEVNNDCADNVNVTAPDLQVNKANDTGGTGTVGAAFDWTLTVANPGALGATFTAGQRILVDDLPAGPTYGAPAPGNFTNITNSTNINCAIAANTLTCDAIGANVTISATTGSFDIVFSVTPNAAGALNNPGGICRVDPNGNVAESNEGNNDCADSVNVTGGGGGDDDDDEPAPPPSPPAPTAPKAQEFNCWPWLVIVPPGAAPNAVPGEWCQASLGEPLPAPSTFRYLSHSTEVVIRDAAGKPVAKFASPIKVCFRYTQPELDAVGGDPNEFLIQTFRDGKWEALDTAPDSSLGQPGVCAPVSHLTLFALFARDGATVDTSAAAADDPLAFPKVLPETGERPFGSEMRSLAMAGVAILALVIGAWLWRRR